MPEGDTIWRAANRLNTAFAGHLITECDFRVPRLATASIAGATMLQVQARGKVIDDVGRLRDVREGPDGLLYLLTENPGRVLRVSPPAP